MMGGKTPPPPIAAVRSAEASISLLVAVTFSSFLNPTQDKK
jgi:hypothetical protein